ncbi:PhyH-domain-containing protein [Mytilinidion resinicola]|uniref:PhyH-domain-containing protein n=1 Tax=Mytilinidion resinicola TaxID=574789 RepID=A0A6A6YGX1_9PEZI|nr:PhyH-domain-containing protein [Mytilinidion resinicola]KAF2807147.1 PhyH-domain-containing protein [Mytilinidion resinicola]
MAVSKTQCDFFKEHGYLILHDVLSKVEVSDLQSWAQEVHDWPREQDSPWMPYEACMEVNARGKRVLCRTENYANYHQGFNSLLRGRKLLDILDQLAGEEMLLFKEKINYKLAGSGGFSPHLDSTAYTHIKDIKHLTILLAVDPSNPTNGGLDVVDGSHEMNVPIAKSDNCIEPAWVERQTWTPVKLEAGELLVFGSYLAHRSGANTSANDRKAIYATYNCKKEGDLHDPYYEDRRKLWPPTHLRQEGEQYSEGSLRYGFGSPMLSIGLGKQFVV